MPERPWKDEVLRGYFEVIVSRFGLLHGDLELFVKVVDWIN